MRRFLLATCLTLVTLPAMAQLHRTGPAMSRPVAGMAAGCMADCLAANGRGTPAAAHAPRLCQLRCDAATRFNVAAQPPVAQPARRGRPGAPQLVGAAMPAMAAPAAMAMPHSVIFVSRSPSRGFGLVVGDGDRLNAYRQAEEQCRVDGAGCRPLMEAPAACGAVAHAVIRHPSAFVMTADPSTWVVTSMSGGFGATRTIAEGEAMADCRSRDPRGTCRIVAARCGAGQS